jgi:hypothetical protein
MTEPELEELRQAFSRVENEIEINEPLSIKDASTGYIQFLSDLKTICAALKSARQDRRRLREAIFLLLKDRDCWANGEPEIPDELSAKFDITLTLARRMVDLVTGKAQAELNV